MKADEVQRRLHAAGLSIQSCERLPNDTGEQIRCETGEIVNVFDTGKVNVQGKNRDARARIEAILGLARGPVAASPAAERTPATLVDRKVFVVYGHDDKAKAELEALLRRWDIEPLILDQLPSEGQTLIEKLEKYTGEDVRFGVVLATPDDEGYAKGKADERKFRARQNVVMELGLLLAKLGRPRVAILLKDQDKMERPSNIDGLIYIPFTDSVEEVKIQLAKEMQRQGLPIAVAKL